MNSDNGKIGFSIELDSSQLNRDIKRSQQAFRDLGNQVETECSLMDNALSGIGRSIASIGAAWSLQEVGRNIATMRGEFQSLQKAMEVMLQSAPKAEALMAQMVQTAATTPFGLQEVAGGAKQLLAYGLEVEYVNDTLIRLGDIASGLKIPLGDLVYLYGTTMTQGRLYTQDFNQFVGRGIPMIQELAKHFNVAESEVRGLVEAGKVGFPEVQVVINNLTNEGGKFFNLMEEESTLINGKISNLKDTFDLMFNEIGQNNEGVINDTLDLSMLLVENYKIVGDVLMTLVADYGVYKATLMAVTAYTNACYSYEIAQLKTVVAEKGAEIDADLASAVSKGRMTAQRAAEIQALRQEIASKIEAATVTERIAKAEMLQAQMKFESWQVTVSLSKLRLAQAKEELIAAKATGDEVAIENAQNNLNTAIKERNNVARQSSILKRNLETASTNANAASQAKATLVTKADTAAKKVQATTTSLLTLCTNGLSKAFKALKVALATNPFGIIMIAITTVIGAFMTLNNTIAETSEEVERFGESAVKTTRNVNLLLTVINNTSADSKVHKDAVNELAGIYEEFGVKIDDEISKLQQLNEKREEVIALIQKEGAERQKANLAAEITKQYNDEMQEAKSDLIENLEETWAGDLLGLTAKHKELKANAKFIASTIETVVGDNLSLIVGKSGDAYIEGIGQIKDKIVKALKEFGISEKTVLDEFARGANSDTGWTSYIEEAKEATETLNAEYERLEQFVDANTESHEKEAEAIDYTTMSFDELFDAAYNTKEEIAKIGTMHTKPLVDTSSIDGALSRTGKLLEDIQLLGKYQLPKPQTMGISDIIVPYRPGYTPAPVLPSASEITTPKSDEQQQALIEIDRRIVEAIKTRKGTSELLKEVNKHLETAEAGSDYEKQLLAIQQRLQTQQSKFRSTGNTQQEIDKANQDFQRLLTQSYQERIELERSLYYQQEQNRINLEKDASTRRLNQLKLDHEKELEELDQQLNTAISQEIQRQKSIFEASEKAKKANNESYDIQIFTDADIDQTRIDEINDKYQTIREQTISLHKQDIVELYRSEFQVMRDAMRNYGTYQQQKLAIAEEYAEKIREATSEGEKLSLSRERDSLLAGITTSEFKANVDWSTVLREFGGMFNTITQPFIENIKAYIETDEFKNADDASKQALLDALRQIDSSYEGIEKVSFKSLGDDVNNFQKLLLKLQGAENNYLITKEELQIAENEYLSSIEEGTEAEQDRASIALKSAKEREAAAAQEVETLQTTVKETGNVIKNNAEILSSSMKGVVSGLQKITSGNLSGIYEGLIELGDSAEKLGGAFGNAFSKISDSLKDVPILGWIVAIIDIFKEGLSEVVGGILDAIFNAVSGIIDDLLSGEFLTQLFSSLFQGVVKIVNSIFQTDFLEDKTQSIEENLDKLSSTIDSLNNAIDMLGEKLEDATIPQAIEIVNAQKEYLNLVRDNLQQLLKSAGGASNFFTHSSNYHINHGVSSDEWKTISEIVDKSVDSAEDFWDLTAEEMSEIAESAPELWTKIKELADNGLANAAQYMEEYIEQADLFEQLEEALNEKLTNTSFDNFRSEFKNYLSDMTMDFADFTNNIEQMFIDAMLEALMINKYDEQIQKLYDDWASYMGDGILTDDERAALYALRNDIINNMQNDRDFIYDTFGSSYGQQSTTGTAGGVKTMTEETSSEMNGRLSSIQLAVNQIANAVLEEQNHLVSIRSITEELKIITMSAVDQLESIQKNTYQLHEMKEILKTIKNSL